MSIVSIDNGRYDRRSLSEQELVVSINWLSIVSIDHDRYDLRKFFRATVDCVDQLTVDRVD